MTFEIQFEINQTSGMRRNVIWHHWSFPKKLLTWPLMSSFGSLDGVGFLAFSVFSALLGACNCNWARKEGGSAHEVDQHIFSFQRNPKCQQHKTVAHNFIHTTFFSSQHTTLPKASPKAHIPGKKHLKPLSINKNHLTQLSPNKTYHHHQ